jgi:hypothetical protein
LSEISLKYPLSDQRPKHWMRCIDQTDLHGDLACKNVYPHKSAGRRTIKDWSTRRDAQIIYYSVKSEKVGMVLELLERMFQAEPVLVRTIVA